jgi:Icc-related predicted phosphoesterase
MRILLVADFHYALPQYDWLASVAGDFDAVIIAGDLLEVSSHVPLDAQIVVIRAYLEKLRSRTRLFVCSGNHDLTTLSPDGEKVAGWLTSPPVPRMSTDGSAEDLDGLLVSVLPWWDGPATRASVAAQLARDAQRDRTAWLWVYHAPPAGSPVSWAGSRHFGDPALSDWIESYRPDYVLCGHVHQAPFVPGGGWVDRVGSAWVFNMGQQPGESPAHIILNSEARAALWFSIYGNQQVSLRDAIATAQPLTVLPDWLRASDPEAGEPR